MVELDGSHEHESEWSELGDQDKTRHDGERYGEVEPCFFYLFTRTFPKLLRFSAPNTKRTKREPVWEWRKDDKGLTPTTEMTS